MIRIRASGIWEWTVTHKRGGVVLDRGEFPNGVTIVGRNYLGDVGLVAGAQITQWYAGLIADASFSAVSDNDSASSHTGWTESQAYDESTRVAWSPGASAAGVITNASMMAFTANTQVRIRGAFLDSTSTKGGTAGTLYCTGLFSSPKLLENDQVLRLRYTHTING